MKRLSALLLALALLMLPSLAACDSVETPSGDETSATSDGDGENNGANTDALGTSDADIQNKNDPAQTELTTDAPAGEVAAFQVGIEGVPAEWQKGIGKALYGMEVSADGSDFSTGYLQKFGNVSADDYAKLIAYFDTLTYTEKLDGVYNCTWGQMQIGHNAAASELTLTWYVN